MKPQTPEEIHELFWRKRIEIIYGEDVAKVSEYDSKDYEYAIEAAKEYARQAIKYALEDAAKNAEVDDYSGAKAYVIKSSILSRYESIIKELGL